MTQTNEYQVTGMSCGHCEAAVRREVSKIEGVGEITVDAKSGRLAFASASAVDDAIVLAAVDEAGYEAARVR